jgi:hypothetical protein
LTDRFSELSNAPGAEIGAFCLARKTPRFYNGDGQDYAAVLWERGHGKPNEDRQAEKQIA